jgi:hypothetical protein
MITWGEYRRIAYMTLRFVAAVLIGTVIGYINNHAIPPQQQTRFHPPCVDAMPICVL